MGLRDALVFELPEAPAFAGERGGLVCFAASNRALLDLGVR